MALRGAEKLAGGKQEPALEPIASGGGDGTALRFRLPVVESFSQRHQGSLEPPQGPHHVHLGWNPPSAALAALLMPSGTRCRNFLQSRARAAASFLCSSALAMSQKPPQETEEQDCINVLFDSKTCARCGASLLLQSSCPCHPSVVTSLCPHPQPLVEASSEETK